MPNGSSDTDDSQKNSKTLINIKKRDRNVETDILLRGEESVDLSSTIVHQISVNSLLILSNLWCGGSKQDKAEALFRMIKTQKLDNQIASSDRMFKFIFEMSVYVSTQFSFKEAMEDNKEAIEQYMTKLGI